VANGLPEVLIELRTYDTNGSC